MLFEHSESLAKLYQTEALTYMIMKHSPLPQKVSCPQLKALNLRLGFINQTKKRFQIEWGSDEQVFEPLTISEGVITVKDASRGPGQEWILSLPAGPFPFAPRATLYSPPMPAASMSAHISIRMSVVDVRIPRVDAKAITSSFAGLFPSNFSGPARLAASSDEPHFTASLLTQDPNDVCFFFPRNNRRLWANESVLRSKSTYFETLFSSDFAESSSTGATADTTCPSPRDLPPYTYAESDLEDDIHSFTSASADHEAERKVSGRFPLKTIKVVDTTFTTYFAVLLWLSTGHISFAPLLSTFSRDSAFSNSVLSQQTLRRNAVQLEKTKNPGLPAPVSPKSVY